MNKVKIFILGSALVAAFSTVTAEKTTTMCDASNSHKCTIYNVGEGTGKLVTTTGLDNE